MTHYVMPFLLSLLYYYSLLCTSEAVFSSSAHHLCHPHEALSLLHFKKEMLHLNSSYASYHCDYQVQYSYPKMISWNKTSSDCCTWDGITCHKITGHVIGLELSCSQLVGVIHDNSTLFRLSHLRKLNLAFNNFSHSKISPNFGELSSLTHLNLSGSRFNGTIPSKLSSSSKLVLLDLSCKYSRDLSFSHGDFQILLRNLTHIRVLSLWQVNILDTLPANWSSSLTYLDLSGTGVHGKLSNSIFHLPRLQNLLLYHNRNLSVSLPKSNSSNTSPLQVLDLSLAILSSSDGFPDSISSFPFLRSLKLFDCGLSGSFPNSIGNLSQIALLDLSGNNFTGNIPLAVSNLPKLPELYLQRNSFIGQFPSHIGNLSELTMLVLDYNLLRGPLPSNLNGFQKLESLYLSGNELDGTMPPWLFSIPSLKELFLNDNHFNGQIKEFVSKSLEVVDFSSNQLDGLIPHSIWQQVNLSFLDLSENNLSGSIELTMSSHLSKLVVLHLSSNKLSLKIENNINISFPILYTLGLSSCGITEFPNFLKNSKNLEILDLSNNKLHGQIPNWILKDSLQYLNLSHNFLSSLGSFNTLMNSLWMLDLRSNQIQEPLPLSVCKFEWLEILDLSHNNFIGSIPECFGNLSSRLQVLNLAKNDLKGAMSVTFRKNDCYLRNLNLNGNSLEGFLPKSLTHCNFLEVLDLGSNKIKDTFPSFLKNLVQLQVLILKSNRFFGSISNFKNKYFLPNLLVFDLSCNEFSGALPPKLFKSFKAMSTMGKTEPKARYLQTNGSIVSYHYSMTFVLKGNNVDLVGILTTFVVIDLSSNNFTEDIPEIIGNLNSLIALNLSHNNFSGHIPSTLGRLYSLQSLDLSWNQIEGEIPQQLADITNLEFLNLSKNHLWGRIPQGKQFNTFLNDSYYGNLNLCGFPVTKSCGGIDLPSQPSQLSNENDEDPSFWSAFTWKSVLVGYGFGFAIGCLVLFTSKPKWLARNIEEVCWYGLLLLGKKKMCKQLMKKSRWGDQKHHRRNN